MILISVLHQRKGPMPFLRCGVLGMAALVTTPLSAQEPAPATEVGRSSLKGIPWDWSHHRVIFSAPRNPKQTARLQKESRYWHQWYHRAAQAAVAELETNEYPPFSIADVEAAATKKRAGLWGQSLVSSSATVGAGNYPAKFSFSTSAPTLANCAGGSAPDYTVFNTSVGGTSTQASLITYVNLYSGICTTGSTVPQTYWAYNTGGSVSTSVVLPESGSQVAFIQSVGGVANLVVLSWSATGGAFTGTTTLNSTTVTITSGSCSLVLAGEPIYGPGIPSGDTIASCASGSITLVSKATASGTSQPLTYNNQFTGSTTNASKSIVVPSCTPFTAGSTIYGAGIPQGDTISTCSGTTLTLTLAATATNLNETITFGPATAGAPVTLTSNSSYPSCTAPCMASVSFGDGNNDTISSPFYNYATDALYVGDSKGNLHEFTPVFKGTPKELTSGWPVAISTNILTGPVYDSTSGKIFVADSGGFLYSYSGSTKVATSQLAASGSKGIVDAPLVDSSANTVYVFVGQDGSTTSSNSCTNATGCNGVFQFSTGFSGGTGICGSTNGSSWTSGTSCGSESVFGVGNSTTVLYDGAFDQIYYTNSGASGNLWTCAATATPAPKLLNTPFSSGSFAATISRANNVVNPLASGAATCCPVSEVYNGATDYIFLSVTANGSPSPSGCTTGNACVYGYNVTTTPSNGCTLPCLSPSAGLKTPGGTSGIIIDNTGSSGQIYFSYLSQATSSIACPSPSGATSGGCAVQASQAALQ